MTKVNIKFKTAKKIVNRIFIVLGMIFISNHSYAQQVKVEGLILDAATNEPVAGANVFLLNEKNGTVADLNGAFSVNVNAFPATISISFIGYRTLEMEVYEYPEPLTVFLQENLNLIDEVVVIGYGTQKRKELTGSVVSISAETLQQPVTSFDQILSGAVPGVAVNQNSGQPGASSTIRIRGGNSINGGNEPLFVIDGFIVYNDNNNSKTNVGQDLSAIGGIDANINLLSTINPADIESIEILKDASATAIYGTRGANGVIIITTKKGKKGSNNISYRSAAGWSEIAKTPKLLSGPEWWAFYRDFNSAGVVAQVEANGGFDPNSTADWVGEALQKGITQDHQLSISGGDHKGRYAVSGNYTSQSGILRNTGYERYSLRANLDREVFRNFRIGLNVLGSYAVQNSLGTYNHDNEVNSWVSILRSSPVVPVYNADGTFNHYNPFADNPEENALSDLLTTTSETKANRALGNFYAEYKIAPDLTAKVNLGADLLGSNQNYYAPKDAIGGHKSNGYALKGNKTAHSWQSEFTLNYDRTYNEIHRAGALFGYTYQRSDLEYGNAIATNFQNEATKHNSLQSGTPSTPYSGIETSVLVSYLGRVNYTLRDKYNLTLTLRADGSSRFGPDNHWAYFPAAGLSWNVNNESFLKAYGTLSNLKLRVSAGITGNQEIPAYLYENTLVPETYSYGGTVVVGFAPGITKPNPGLKWERTTQYNAGIDLGLRKDRITVTFDAYYKKTTDLLLLLPVEKTTGYENTYANAGSVSNKGIEIGLNIHAFKSKNFNWHTGLNGSRNVNKVLDLGGLDEIQPIFPAAGALSTVYPTIVRPGLPLGTFYGYRFEGVVQQGEDVSTVPVASWITDPAFQPQPGYPKYANQNDDHVITSEDKVVLGNAQPDFIAGFNNTFVFKRWDASFYFLASYGNELYNALENKLNIPYHNYNASAALKDRWTTGNPSNSVPKAYEASTFVMDDRFIEDASYLRLKNVTVGYTVPFRIRGLTQKPSLRIFFTAQNLFTLTGYKGFDPEASRIGNTSYEQSSLYQGVDYGAYPSTRTFLFGINLNL
ncbi:MAG: TonB-dependent receptor [Tannerella sp.]|jgi:TonB-linked SusC/RagA family outer membrane protein|nr:TonB-dependent receptor [Tannerella sp.]